MEEQSSTSRGVGRVAGYFNATGSGGAQGARCQVQARWACVCTPGPYLTGQHLLVTVCSDRTRRRRRSPAHCCELQCVARVGGLLRLAWRADGQVRRKSMPDSLLPSRDGLQGAGPLRSGPGQRRRNGLPSHDRALQKIHVPCSFPCFLPCHPTGTTLRSPPPPGIRGDLLSSRESSARVCPPSFFASHRSGRGLERNTQRLNQPLDSPLEWFRPW